MVSTTSFASDKYDDEFDLGKGRYGDVLHVHYPPDPVNVRNGNFYLPVQDYYLSCFGFPLEIYRSYNSVSIRNGPFGKGWTFNYDIQIVVDEEAGLRIVESDGFVNEYTSVEMENESLSDVILKMVAAKKKEDVKYLGKPEGKGEVFYKDYEKKLKTDEAFLKRQRDRYLPTQSKISKSGKYVSHKRGTTHLEKTLSGFIRTNETGRKEEYDAKGLLLRLEDRNNNELTFNYNPESRLEQISDSCGQSFQIVYGPAGKIRKIKDSLQRELKYDYDADDRLIVATALDGEKTNFGYDKLHRMTSITFADGTKTEIQYDPKTGYVTKQTGPGTKITNYQYGKEGEKVWATVEDNEGGKSRYEYIDSENKIIFMDKSGKKTITTVTACCGKPLSIKNDKGVGEEFRYDEKGNLISKTNPQRQTTTFSYEPRFNLPSEIKAHDGSFMRFTYDNKGNLSFSRGSGGEYVKLEYERHGKIQTMTDHHDTLVRFDYNASGKPILIEKAAKKARVGSIRVAYDKTGEILKVEYDPQKPEVVQEIKDTLNSFLRLLKPSGIDFEI